MKSKCLQAGLLLLMVTSSLQATARIIPTHGYTLSGNIVSNGVLDWLSWEETRGLSIEQVLANPVYSEWNLATEVHMLDLLYDFGVAMPVPVHPVSNQHVYRYGYSGSSDETVADLFIELFGTTRYEEGGIVGFGGDAIRTSEAYWGAGVGGLYHLVAANSDFTIFGYQREAQILLAQDDYMRYDRARDSTGVALVRSVIDVSAPSSLAVFALGIMGLAIRRSKKQY